MAYMIGHENKTYIFELTDHKCALKHNQIEGKWTKNNKDWFPIINDQTKRDLFSLVPTLEEINIRYAYFMMTDRPKKNYEYMAFIAEMRKKYLESIGEDSGINGRISNHDEFTQFIANNYNGDARMNKEELRIKTHIELTQGVILKSVNKNDDFVSLTFHCKKIATAFVDKVRLKFKQQYNHDTKSWMQFGNELRVKISF